MGRKSLVFTRFEESEVCSYLEHSKRYIDSLLREEKLGEWDQ